jgi:putative ABC transport system permease protein
VLLGFIVGVAIAGQTFYSFTLENLKQFGALKAMGAGNWLLLRMILLQAAVVGVIGYGIGVGTAAYVFGGLARKSPLAFYLPPQLLMGTGAAVLVICTLSALVSIVKVLRLEPAIVFKS